jgi:hypothetical protein
LAARLVQSGSLARRRPWQTPAPVDAAIPPTLRRRPRSARAAPPPREVCFVKYYQKGSTEIAADQMAAALKRRGLAARSLFAADIGNVRDAVLVFIKRADLADLLRGRALGNRLIADVHDTVVFRRGVRYSALYHGIIFRNQRAAQDFGQGRPGVVVIPHHWDDRYAPHRAPLDGLRLAYIGEPRSFPPDWELPAVEMVLDDWFARAPAFNAHLSVRRPGREMLYKPNMKVATAAACAAVLLTTRDASATEHLGADYPFYMGPTRADVVAAIQRAAGEVGGAAWQRAIAILAAVKERTSLDRITDRYLDYLQRFGAVATVPAGAPSERSS